MGDVLAAYSFGAFKNINRNPDTISLCEVLIIPIGGYTVYAY